jgi:hypothetical protein
MQEWRTDIFGNNYGLFKQVLPSSIKNLGLWYSADYGTLSAVVPDKATNPNGGKVIRWLDRSGNNNHLNAYNTAPELNSSFIKPLNAPVIKQNYINGKPAVYFDGTSNLHLNSFLRNKKEVTIYVVGKYHEANTSFARHNYQPMLSYSLSSALIKDTQYFENETFALYQHNGNNAFGFGNPVADSTNPNKFGNPIIFNSSKNLISEIQITNSEFNIFEFVFTPSFASSFINDQYYMNTKDLGKTLGKNLNMSAINDSDGMWVASYGGGQYPTKCAIAEIIVFDRALTNRERIDVNNYLSDKYFNGYY